MCHLWGDICGMQKRANRYTQLYIAVPAILIAVVAFTAGQSSRACVFIQGVLLIYRVAHTVSGGPVWRGQIFWVITHQASPNWRPCFGWADLGGQRQVPPVLSGWFSTLPPTPRSSLAQGPYRKCSPSQGLAIDIVGFCLSQGRIYQNLLLPVQRLLCVCAAQQWERHCWFRIWYKSCFQHP